MDLGLKLINRDHVILIMKLPVTGKVKTRLIPKLTATGAAELAENMIKDTLELLSSVKEKVPQLVVTLYFAGSSQDEVTGIDVLNDIIASTIPDVTVKMVCNEHIDQAPTNLSDILKTGLSDSRKRSYATVSFIGMDCPQLDPTLLQLGIQAARRGHAHLIPSQDGGYVALSIPTATPDAIFDGIQWSSAQTLSHQKAAIEKQRFRVTVATSAYRDVDEEEDLDAFIEASEDHLRRGACRHTHGWLAAIYSS